MIIVVPLLVAGAELFQDQAGNREDGESLRMSREEIEMELAFARLQKSFRDRKTGTEESRIEMARWHREQAGRMERIASQRALRVSPPPPDPGKTLARNDRNAVDFLNEVNEYKSQLIAFVRHAAAGDAEWGRQEIARRMEHPSVKAMEAEVELARQELAAIPLGDDVLPLPPDELAALTGWERAEEEIYAAIYAVTRKPYSPGDEFRNRIAPLYDWIEHKRKAVAGERADETSLQAAERIRWLESQFDQFSQEVDNP